MTLKRLDEKHYEAITLLLDGKKSQRQIAEEIGVHYNTITNWQKDPLFQAELKQSVINRTHGRLSELVDAMMDTAITQGNAAMAKLILQMNSMITDKVSVEANVNKPEIDYDELDKEVAAFSKSFADDNHNDV